MLRRHRHTSVVIAVAALVAIVPKADGSGATAITTCGQTVTTNAVLTQDLDCHGSSGVIVGASGITIDLKGFQLRGDGTHYGIDDTAGFAKVRIKNGVLRSFDKGAWAINADGFSVLGVVATQNLTGGIDLAGASVSVKSSVAVSNGHNGISLDGPSGSVKSSAAFANDHDGINLGGGSLSVTSATASGNGNIGIIVNSNSGSIKASTASANGSYGIWLMGAGQIKGNHADGNGFATSSGVGILGTADTTGSNLAHANYDPAECDPAALCCAHTLCGSHCVNVAIDPANCGKCGHICPGLICSAGVCQP